MKNIMIVVSASVAAYKTAKITDLLVAKGYNVNIAITKNACKFVTPLTFKTISNNFVLTDYTIQDYNGVAHVELMKNADIVVVVPATANIIGKMANGIADDIVSSMLVVDVDVPRIFAPAMNVNMYENEIVQANINKLKNYGWEEIKPIRGHLANGEWAIGALEDEYNIVEIIEEKIS